MAKIKYLVQENHTVEIEMKQPLHFEVLQFYEAYILNTDTN